MRASATIIIAEIQIMSREEAGFTQPTKTAAGNIAIRTRNKSHFLFYFIFTSMYFYSDDDELQRRRSS